jgi:hypothetical protein
MSVLAWTLFNSPLEEHPAFRHRDMAVSHLFHNMEIPIRDYLLDQVRDLIQLPMDGQHLTDTTLMMKPCQPLQGMPSVYQMIEIVFFKGLPPLLLELLVVNSSKIIMPLLQQIEHNTTYLMMLILIQFIRAMYPFPTNT